MTSWNQPMQIEEQGNYKDVIQIYAEHYKLNASQRVDISFATHLDGISPSSRSEFHIPSIHAIQQQLREEEKTQHTQTNPAPSTSSFSTTDECIYLCGNSLGLQPKTTSLYVNTELTKWQQLGVEGHFYGDRPWSLIDEQVTQLSQELVGGKKDEVAILNTLSVNLHMLLLSFYKPHGIRNKILMENFAFCSDHHIIQSQLQYHGVDLNNIVYLKADEKGVKWEVIQSAIETHRDTLSLVFLPGIQFYSGEYFPMQQITALAHKYEIAVGFDLAHTAGNMPLHLHDWQVDFAAWCSYKYLNSGPGSIGGIYIHERHHERIQQEKMLAGWWGQDAAVRFQMKSSHQAARGAQCFKMSNPPVFSTVCLLASLEIFNKAKMKVLRNKSIVLTAYLEHLINTFLPLTSSHPTLPCTVSILTPPTLASRGCQLSLFFSCPVKQLHRAVVMRGVIGDIRQPNVIRLSPTPLYNTFTDVWYTIQTFKEEMEKINQAK